MIPEYIITYRNLFMNKMNQKNLQIKYRFNIDSKHNYKFVIFL